MSWLGRRRWHIGLTCPDAHLAYGLCKPGTDSDVGLMLAVTVSLPQNLSLASILNQLTCTSCELYMLAQLHHLQHPAPRAMTSSAPPRGVFPLLCASPPPTRTPRNATVSVHALSDSGSLSAFSKQLEVRLHTLDIIETPIIRSRYQTSSLLHLGSQLGSQRDSTPS